MGYIYKITNTLNNKIYIGQTITSILKRFSSHISDAKSGNSTMAIHNAMNKYGYDKFHIQEIVRVQNDDLNILKEELSKRISADGHLVNGVINKIKTYSIYSQCKHLFLFLILQIR